MDIKDLRLLDVDDLIILDGLYRGSRLKEISVSLMLTPPALSHRLKKMKGILREEIFLKNPVRISESGKADLKPFVAALRILKGFPDKTVKYKQTP